MIAYLKGALRSNTIQFNTFATLLWPAFYNSELVQNNPQYLAYAAIGQSVINNLLRAKTKKPLAER